MPSLLDLRHRLEYLLLRAIVGLVPGPLLVMSYRPALFDERLRRYVLRAAGYEGPWSKGESELFAAFVSNLNACHF